MSAPIILSTIPVASAVGVYLNEYIIVQFNQALTVSTINDNTVLLYRVSDSQILDKTLSFSVITNQLTISPSVVFDQNTEYNVVIVGTDQSQTCVQNLTGQSLVTTSNWTFTTGTELQDNAPAPDEVDEMDVDQSTSPSPVSEVLPPITTTNLIITSVSPENYADNIGSMNGDYETSFYDGPITITFNQPMPSGVQVSQSWVTLEYEAADGDPATPVAMPSGSLSNVYGNTLSWTTSPYAGNDYTWCINNVITVTVSSLTPSAAGNTLGNNYRFMFTTPYFPYYSTVSQIRATIGSFIREIPSDTIARNIYLNSIEAYNIANTIYSQYLWDMSSPTFAAKKWVFCKTQYDLLYSKLLDMASSGPGMIKRLGDFTIQESTEMQEGVKGALNKALECSNAYLKLLLGKFRRAKAKMVVRGVTSPATPPIRGVRTWSLETGMDRIGANKTLERRIKSPGLYSDWS